MIFSKTFTAGLITGAVMGGMMGMWIEPMSGSNTKKIKKNAGCIMHSLGNIFDTITDMKG